MHSINSLTQRGWQAASATGWLLEVGLWVVNVGAAFFVTRYLFTQNSLFIFFGRDPHSLLAFIGERRRFSSTMAGVGSDPVIGLGNISFPLNPDWFPSYLLTATTAGDLHDGPLAFAIGATELFAVTALCARAVGLAAAPSFMAAWLITVLTWQLVGMPIILTLWFLFPHHAELLGLSSVMALAALEIGDRPWWRSALFAAGIFLGITYITVALPTSLVLCLPIIMIFAGAKFLFGADGRGRLIILLSWAAIALAALAGGYVHYVAGLLNYSAISFFPDLTKRGAIPLFGGDVSMLFWAPEITGFSLKTIFTPERSFLFGGISGSAMMAWLGSARQRRLGLALLVAEFVWVTIGLTNYFTNFWFGPSPWYFEQFLSPFFAIGCAYLLVTLLSQLWRLVPSSQSPLLRQRIAYVFSVGVSVLLPGIVAGHAFVIGPQLKEIGQQSPLFKYGVSYPEPQTEITRILKAEIGLVPGHAFRGRSATMLGFIVPQERRADRIGFVYYLAQFATGNLHDGPGLWQDDIPTLMEYNTLLTPAHLAVTRRFFTEASDRISRNTVLLRRIDMRMLKLLGARFLVIDTPLEGARLWTRLRIPTPREDRIRLAMPNLELEHFDIYLYELADANLGQFSPTRVKVIPDAGKTLAALSDSSLALEETVIVGEPLRDDLTKATLKTFTVDRDRYHVQAVSEGPAILLLPIEFSRCLKVSSRSAGVVPHLFRADLLLTGILFEKELNADISFHSGPFRNSRCRLDDRADLEKLDMRNAFKEFPDYAVVGLGHAD